MNLTRRSLWLLLASVLPLTSARAEDAAPPADWVAQCGGRTLTLGGLAQSCVRRFKPDLLDPATGPTTVLRQLVEERVVQQEARALGIQVTDADVDRRSRELDTEIRTKTNGEMTLKDVIYKELRTNLPEYRASLRDLLRKERIAEHPKYLGAGLPRVQKQRWNQITVVVTELLKKAKVVYGVPTALQEKPAELGPSVIATVNGEPITAAEYGLALSHRLPLDDVQRVISQECRAVLTESVALSDAQMEAMIEKERQAWLRDREMATEEAWRNVPYEEKVKMQHGISLDELKASRFFRGQLGLIESFRAQVKPEEIREEYEKKKATLYGESIRVTDVSVGFVQKNTLIPAPNARERRDALRMANDLLVQKESGVPFDQITRGVNAKNDRSFQSKSRRLRDTDDDRILWDRAQAMKDGEVAIVETLSAVHVIRREARVPAPAYDEVRMLIQDGLATRRADEWLRSRLNDPAVCQIRWPPPEDVWAQAIRSR